MSFVKLQYPIKYLPKIKTSFLRCFFEQILSAVFEQLLLNADSPDAFVLLNIFETVQL